MKFATVDDHLATFPLSMYPVPAGDEAYERDVAAYRAAKGTLGFPFGAPIPYALIERTAKLLAQPPED